MGEIIRIACDRCDRVIEVEASRAGEKIECPDCGDINVVPRVAPSPSRVVEDAPTDDGEKPTAARTKKDKAAAAGLPPDSGPEQRVMRVRPTMLRRRPLPAAVVLTVFAAGWVALIWSLFPALIWLGVLGAVAIVASGLVLAWWWVGSLSAALEISNKRTVLHEGLLSKATSEVVHDNIRNVQIHQTFTQRVFGVGSIGISSSGQDGIEIELGGVRDPERIRRVIDLYRPL